MPDNTAELMLKNLYKTNVMGEVQVSVLRGIDTDIY